MTRAFRTLVHVSTFFRPSPARQLSALFTRSADNWLLLDLGADWESGQVRTLAATRRPWARRRLQGFQCVYRRAEPPATTVVLSQERFEHVNGADREIDQARLAAAARTVHALAQEIAESLPTPDWLPQSGGIEQVMIAGRMAVVHHLPDVGLAIQVTVLTLDDLLLVIAAHQCAPRLDLVSGLRAHPRLVMSPDGLIIGTTRQQAN